MDTRALELTRLAGTLAAAAKLRVWFAHSAETDPIGYFPENARRELASVPADRAQWVDDPAQADLLVVTAHGSDLSSWLRELRGASAACIAVWLWDNHLSELDNLKTALAADFLFVSHLYAAGACANPGSALVGHVPACTAQWPANEARAAFEASLNLPRSDRLLVNYVNYRFSWRCPLLERLRDDMPQADVLLAPPEDRSRYFGRSRAQRLQEWLGYKTALILPVDKDLSTRLFDALLAGLVPVVPERVIDLDVVIPRDLQREIEIVRFLDLDLEGVRGAHREALARFDRGGIDGMRKRHRFAADHHTLAPRLRSIVSAVRSAGTSGEIRCFGAGARPFGQYWVGEQ
jgi:hypothetical protein